MSGHLERLLEQATPGPWRLEYDSYDKYYDMPSPEDSTWVWRIEGICDFANEEGSEADAALIARAPDTTRLLIDMAAALTHLSNCRWDIEKPALARLESAYNKAAPLLARFAALDTEGT